MKKKIIILNLSLFFSLLCYSQNATLKKDTVLCSGREMVQLFQENYFDTIPPKDCNNVSAINRFNEKINVLKQVIANKTTDLNQIINIILNFELLTHIESKSDANYFGKYNPKNEDIVQWETWLETNQSNLCWYKEKDILFLRKGE